MEIKKREIKKGILLFVSITVVVVVGILIFTVNKKTWVALKSFKVYFILILFIYWVLLQIIDGWRFKILVNEKGESKLGVIDSISIITIGYFLSIVTPFQFGGLPFQLIFMKRRGISVGKSLGYLTIRGFLIWGPVMFFSIFFLFWFGMKIKLVLPLFILYAVIGLAIFTFMILIISAPGFMRNLSIKILRKTKRKFLRKIIRWAIKESAEFGYAFKLLLKKDIASLLLILFLSVIFFIMLYSTVYLILLGMNLNPNYIKAMGVQLVSTTFSLWSPSPGGAGIVEITSAFFYSLVCPKHLIGILVIVWRFFITYLGGIVGGIFLLREIHR